MLSAACKYTFEAGDAQNKCMPYIAALFALKYFYELYIISDI